MASLRKCYRQLDEQRAQVTGPREYIPRPNQGQDVLPGFTAPEPEPVRVTRGRMDDRQGELFAEG